MGRWMDEERVLKMIFNERPDFNYIQELYKEMFEIRNRLGNRVNLPEINNCSDLLLCEQWIYKGNANSP